MSLEKSVQHTVMALIQEVREREEGEGFTSLFSMMCIYSTVI